MKKLDSTVSDKDQIIMSLAMQLVGMKHPKLSLKDAVKQVVDALKEIK